MYIDIDIDIETEKEKEIDRDDPKINSTTEIKYFPLFECCIPC